MEYFDGTEPFLTETERKQVCKYLKAHPDKIPTPATDGEINTILSWLNTTRKDTDNFDHFQYKDCAFDKIDFSGTEPNLDGNDAKWKLSHKNMDYIWINYKEGL